MAHVVVTTTLPVLDCPWLAALMLRTISARRNILSLKFLQRKHVPPFPSDLITRNTVTNTVREGPKCSLKQNFRDPGKPSQLTRACRSIDRLVQKPNLQFLAQHVQCHMAAQGYLCHLPVLQEERDFSPSPYNPMTYNVSLLTLSA